MMRFVLAVGLSVVALFAGPAFTRAADPPATRPAAGAEAVPRKLLVLTLTKGFKHDSIPTAVQVLRDLGESTGAFDPTITEDVSHFDPDRLNQFDAVLFCNTTGELPFTDVQKQALLDFVAGGKGFVGVHAATDTFYGWPAFGEMIGAYFDGHPWNAKDTVTIRAERHDHPIARCFAPSARLTEEIYQFKAPYDRSKLDVLMSLDTSATDMTKRGIKRTDGDFPVAWTRPYGKGRVFYTSLGHNEAVWEDGRFKGHLLAGIRWASGESEKPEDRNPNDQ